MKELKNKMSIMFNYYEMDAIYQSVYKYYCVDCPKRKNNDCTNCGIDNIQNSLVRGMNTLRQEFYMDRKENE